MNTFVHCLLAAAAGAAAYYLASFSPAHQAVQLGFAFLVFALVLAVDLGVNLGRRAP